jgi:hypothetical protein
MDLGEDYVKIAVGIGDFSKEVTGVSVVDSYFGPKSLLRKKAKPHWSADKFLIELDALIEKAKDIDDALRRVSITRDLESMKVVVRWLSGEQIPYRSLVEGIFGLTPLKFGEKEIRKAQHAVEDACSGLPGSDVSEKVLKWREQSKISGQALRKMVDKEVAEHTQRIRNLFKKRVFSLLGSTVQDNGIVYKTARGKPWGAYNYYQGNFRSTNIINIDMPFNKYTLVSTLCHEYEHHVSNLFTENSYRKDKALDLSVVLLHTQRSIISEGTAECARDFLGLELREFGGLVQSLRNLGSMVNLNATYMLNVENVDDDTVAEYVASEAYVPAEDAKKRIRFDKPLNSDGRINLWKPYIYTYFFGRRDYVLPTFKKARKKDKLGQFYQTLYLNPYSRSAATWKAAFSGI